MSIFPEDVDIKETMQQSELPMFKEYAINLETGEMIYENGTNKIVEGNEALKIWIWKALHVNKSKYKIYSSNYGNELEMLVSKEYSKELIESEANRYLEECLLVNPYIKSIENVEVNLEGSKLTINVKVKTIYGEVEANV